VKTTLILDDSLYKQAKVIASERGATVSSIVEEALRLMIQVKNVKPLPTTEMPAWDLGRPLIDVDDARTVRETLDTDRDIDALR